MRAKFNSSNKSLCWTVAEIKVLEQAWADKKIRLKDIAARLGKTKNAVIGKAFRLKLKERKPERKPKTAFKKKAKTVPKKLYKNPVLTKPRYVNYSDIRHGLCQFPLSETPFEKPYGWCGEPCFGIYCKQHKEQVSR